MSTGKADAHFPDQDSGWHNVENYMAAIAAVWGDVEPETIRQVAATFNGVEHRQSLSGSFTA